MQVFVVFRSPSSRTGARKLWGWYCVWWLCGVILFLNLTFFDFLFFIYILRFSILLVMFFEIFFLFLSKKFTSFKILFVWVLLYKSCFMSFTNIYYLQILKSLRLNHTNIFFSSRSFRFLAISALSISIINLKKRIYEKIKLMKW